MKLEDYKKLVEIQLLTENGLQNILEANKAYQNNEIEKDFNNAKMFKTITESNKELIDRIEKKTDQSDEIIKQFKNALPIYNQQIPEPLKYEDGNENKELSEKLNTMNIFDNNDEINFITNLIKGNRVFLYKGKQDNVEHYSNIKLIDLGELNKYTIDELKEYLKSDELTKFTKQLSGAKKYHEGFEMKIGALNKYKEAIKGYIHSRDFVKKIDKPDDKEDDKQDDKVVDDKPADDKQTDDKQSDDKPADDKITEIEGKGIKRRNRYKIENGKYNEKIKINMDKLYNNYYVEAWYNNDIIYENQGDRDTLELLTKSRINKKKKYSKLSQQIFNDMITLSGMVKKRNAKNKLLGSSNIILNEHDRQKRIELLRGSIVAGNDNEKLHNELSKLSNQENVTQNKSVNDLYRTLKTLTPLMKTSKADVNTHNQVYNIIDYLRSNKYISRDQYHKYIKKHLM